MGAIVMEDSVMKKLLKELCLSSGWSYGVFWRFDQRNSMLLTLEDAYYEDEHVGHLIHDFCLPVHVLGEGTIGQTALNGKHRWMINYCILENNDAQFSNQFFSGIKTIAVIPVESRGVAQFGSTKEIMEASQIVDQTRRLIQGTHGFFRPLASLEMGCSSLNDDQNGLPASVLSSENSLSVDHMLCQQPLSSVQLDSSSSWMNTIENFLCDTMFDPLLCFPGPTDMEVQDQCSSIKLVSNSETFVGNGEPPHSLNTSTANELKPVDLPPSLFDSYTVDDLSQWLSASPDNQCLAELDNMVTTKNVSLQAVGVDSLPSGDTRPAYSSQSSITNAFSSCGSGKSLDLPAVNTDLFDGLGEIFGCRENRDTKVPLVDNRSVILPANTMSSVSDSVSEVEGGSKPSKRRGLFSELGLDELLNSAAAGTSSVVTECGIIDQDQMNTAKRRKMESVPVIGTQIQFTGNSRGMESLCSDSAWKMCDMDDFRESKPKTEQVSSWINDSYRIMSAKSCTTSQQPKTILHEEPQKGTKKRARPGESTRPRPKDRQLIADRIKDLREMIPNGAKCSIDSLLDKTIKHMLFLENLTKHANKLKDAGKPKLNGHENSTVQHPRSCAGSGNASTNCSWVVEIGGETSCPIKVENLSHPGLMLIEMLCDDRGFFLEIADAIRSFGLSILKGLLEVRKEKIWAHFIVETNRHIERVDIVIPLIRLFLDTATSKVNNANEGACLSSF